jgi:catechol 2,3-dioxygenase-like lactoylglutathione lyase family enzyme
MAKGRRMACLGLNHINIGCSASELPAIERFYGDVLSLRRGFRPAFLNDGLWLYHGERPIVHVVARFPDGWNHEPHRGGFDHIAFSMTGAAEVRERLERLGYTFEQQNVPEAGFQIFLCDPAGNKVELNFPGNEAPESVASGTLAPMQFPT